MYHKVPIENFPLQTYTSALLFSPTRSLIRRLFKQEAPTWITILPGIQDNWDACLQTLEGHSSYVKSVVFAHDSNQLASTSFVEVKIWDTISGQCLQTLETHDHIDSVTFSQDSKQVATVSADGTVRIWNVIDGKCLLTLEWPASLGVQHVQWGSISFSRNSAQLVSTHLSKLALWNLSNDKCPKILEGHNDDIKSVSFSDDSNQLASVSNNGSVKIWDADIGKCLKTHCLKTHGYNVHFQSAAFFKDLTLIISSSYFEIVIWDGNSGECLQAFDYGARSLALSHDSMQLALGLHDSTMIISDVNSGKCLHSFKGHSDSIHSLSFSHDSTHLASASEDGTVKIWDLSQGQVLQRHGNNNSSTYSSIALSHDSTQLALAGQDAILEVWDVRKGKCLHTLEGDRPIALSSDSTQLVSASDDRAVKLWDLGTGKCLQTFNGHHNQVISIAFSPDSKYLASASEDQSCKVWDMDTGECLKTFENCYMHDYSAGNTIALSHDSSQLAATSDKITVKVWDTSSGECIQIFKHQDRDLNIASVALSKILKRLASATSMYVVKIWNVNNGQCLHTFRCNDVIYQMSFDITGLYLHTSGGIIDIHASSPATDITQADAGLPRARYRGLALTGLWITYNSENLVWLPSEFRHAYMLAGVSEKAIGVVDGYGRPWMYSFDLDRLSTAQECSQ
jgi:WD40 repeat protein